MTLLRALIDSLPGNAPVHTLLVGAHWTIICSRHCGMAATVMPPNDHGAAQVREAGTLHHKSARELAEYALSDNLIEASIGMAAINSLLEVDESQAVEINALDVLIEKGRGRNVALVGHFPFIPRLRPRVGKLWVLEQHPVEDDHPAEAAPDLLPQADVVAITSSALINHTLEGLLRLCRPEALVMTLGPSTPLSPLLFQYGISILAGVKVTDSQALLQTVSQAATFQQVAGVRLLTLSHSKEEHS